GPRDGDYVLRQIHYSICGHHIGGHNTQGHQILVLVANYDERGLEDDIKRQTEDHRPILNPVPFAQWALDILRPLLAIIGQNKWLIVETNYFKNWTQVEAILTLIKKNVRKSIWQNILKRSGILMVLLFDHETHFDHARQSRILRNSLASNWSTF
ncbi:HD protein-like protein, partial [Bienertia sinuspersici]